MNVQVYARESMGSKNTEINKRSRVKAVRIEVTASRLTLRHGEGIIFTLIYMEICCIQLLPSSGNKVNYTVTTSKKKENW